MSYLNICTLSLAFLIAAFSGVSRIERLSSFFLEGVLIDTLFGLMQWFFFPDAVMAKDRRKKYNANHSMNHKINKWTNYMYITNGKLTWFEELIFCNPVTWHRFSVIKTPFMAEIELISNSHFTLFKDTISCIRKWAL